VVFISIVYSGALGTGTSLMDQKSQITSLLPLQVHNLTTNFLHVNK